MQYTPRSPSRHKEPSLQGEDDELVVSSSSPPSPTHPSQVMLTFVNKSAFGIISLSKSVWWD